MIYAADILMEFAKVAAATGAWFALQWITA
jgi:hypothetical protein